MNSQDRSVLEFLTHSFQGARWGMAEPFLLPLPQAVPTPNTAQILISTVVSSRATIIINISEIRNTNEI